MRAAWVSPNNAHALTAIPAQPSGSSPCPTAAPPSKPAAPGTYWPRARSRLSVPGRCRWLAPDRYDRQFISARTAGLPSHKLPPVT